MYILKLKRKCKKWLLSDMCRKQPIIALYFEFDNELKFSGPGPEVIKLEYSQSTMIGCLQTRAREQPIIALYFESGSFT